MSDLDLQELLIDFKSKVHPWIRLNRVIRDIPDHYISGGNAKTNLRQDLLEIMKHRGMRCECIRCREVRLDKSKIATAQLVVRRYRAAGGAEYFLSFETPDRRTIFGFLRLRITDRAGMVDRGGNATTSFVRVDGSVAKDVAFKKTSSCDLVFPELRDCALVRELHVYGKLLPAGRKNKKKSSKKKKESQHYGFGTRLMRHAEHIAFLHNRTRLAVIAGVGTRKYYEKLGYTKSRSGGEYMIRAVHPTAWARLARPFHRLCFLLYVIYITLQTNGTFTSTFYRYGHDPDRTGVPSYSSWMPSILAFLIGVLGVVLALVGLFV